MLRGTIDRERGQRDGSEGVLLHLRAGRRGERRPHPLRCLQPPREFVAIGEKLLAPLQQDGAAQSVAQALANLLEVDVAEHGLERTVDLGRGGSAPAVVDSTA